MIKYFKYLKDIKFMLLHETKNEDSIRNFFNECYELYLKVRCIFKIFFYYYLINFY